MYIVPLCFHKHTYTRHYVNYILDGDINKQIGTQIIILPKICALFSNELDIPPYYY